MCLHGSWTASHIGFFHDEDDAARRYDEAAEPLGRPLNFPKNEGDLKATKYGKKSGCSSNFIGVKLHTHNGKWQAGIRLEKKQHHIGTYKFESEAARAYDEQAVFHDAPLNFPEEAPSLKQKTTFSSWNGARVGGRAAQKTAAARGLARTNARAPFPARLTSSDMQPSSSPASSSANKPNAPTGGTMKSKAPTVASDCLARAKAPAPFPTRFPSSDMQPSSSSSPASTSANKPNASTSSTRRPKTPVSRQEMADSEGEGVHWDSSNLKWPVRVVDADGDQVALGIFSTQQAAAHKYFEYADESNGINKKKSSPPPLRSQELNDWPRKIRLQPPLRSDPPTSLGAPKAAAANLPGEVKSPRRGTTARLGTARQASGRRMSKSMALQLPSASSTRKRGPLAKSKTRQNNANSATNFMGTNSTEEEESPAGNCSSSSMRRSKQPTSKHSGVTWNDKKGKWAAHTRYSGLLIPLGFFDTEDTAIHKIEGVMQKRKRSTPETTRGVAPRPPSSLPTGAIQ